MAKQPDSESFTDVFTKFGQDLKMPRVDVEAIIAHHRKNIEAFQKSASASVAGAQSLMAKQREILQETLREVTDMAQSYRISGNPQEMMTKQGDFARKTFEAAVKNAGEVAEIVTNSGRESIEILRQRIQESMEEIRAGYEKRK